MTDRLKNKVALVTAAGQGIGYNRSAFTTDGNYNITLGATHLGSLIDEFNGSYVMAIAAYNADAKLRRCPECAKS